MIRKSINDFSSLLVIIVLIFGFAMALFIIYNISDKMVPGISGALSRFSTADFNVTESLDQSHGSLLNFDWMFPLLIIGCLGFVGVVAYMSGGNPVVIFIGILVLIPCLVIAASLSNSVTEIRNADSFSSTETTFPIIQIFIDNLAIVALIGFLLIGGIIYLLYYGLGGIR